MAQAYDRYQESRDRYQESRDVWQDYNHRQEFEHDLINRKTSWWLTGQTILFAAYGVTLRSDLADKGNEFQTVVALSGLAVAVVTGLGVLALILSKCLSWWDYRRFFSAQPPIGLQLPRPLNERSLQWGVRTWNTFITLAPDVFLPIIFAVAWVFLLRR
jgi:hypothetical protein